VGSLGSWWRRVLRWFGGRLPRVVAELAEWSAGSFEDPFRMVLSERVEVVHGASAEGGWGSSRSDPAGPSETLFRSVLSERITVVGEGSARVLAALAEWSGGAFRRLSRRVLSERAGCR